MKKDSKCHLTNYQLPCFVKNVIPSEAQPSRGICFFIDFSASSRQVGTSVEMTVGLFSRAQLPFTNYHLPITNNLIMRNEPNFSKSQMVATLLKTTNYNEKLTMDTWSKRTQTNPILTGMRGLKIWLNLTVN